jgi:hypothetical protein
MARYGLVELAKRPRGRIAPRVPYDRIRLDLPLLATARNQRRTAA